MNSVWTWKYTCGAVGKMILIGMMHHVQISLSFFP